MKTIENKHNIEFYSSDINGHFMLRLITTNGFQLQIKTDLNEAFIDVDKKEIEAIIELLKKGLERI